MARILKRTSFGLLRTNPRLTTNLKIVADSKDQIFMESFDADPILSKSIYKGYRLSPDGDYSYDIRRFYAQNDKPTPKDVAYKVFEKDASLSVKERYGNQYDFTYAYGAAPKNSRIYDEEFSLFAPVWLEKDNLPECFVIFRLDGPSTVNVNDADILSAIGGSTANLDSNEALNQLVISPEKFFENYIEKAKIITSFDLTRKTGLGRYMRNHIENERLPESSLYINPGKGNLSYWQGVSYDNGGFCKKAEDLYKDYFLIDKTMIESDEYITNGFRRNGVIVSNIMNIEYLFSDPEVEDYRFSRYFGLYMNKVELGRFILNKSRLYQDKDVEVSQIPRPIIDNYGDPLNFTSQIQTNERGIKIYPNIENGLPYSGRLLTFDEVQNPRFGYVKDTRNNLYSVDSKTNWASTISTGGTSYIDTDYIRIKSTSVDWKNFGGIEAPFNYIRCYKTSKRGRPVASFKVTGQITVADEIRIRYTDWNDPNQQSIIDFYTIEGSNTLNPGEAQVGNFSINGTQKDVALSISKAINLIQDYIGEEQIFYSIAKGNEVIIYSKVDSENWNKLRYSLFSNAATFPWTPTNTFQSVSQVVYQPSPISLSAPQFGFYYEAAFDGGNNNVDSRVIIDKTSINEFRDPNDDIYIKTDKGYSRVSNFSIYTDKPVYGINGEIIDFTDSDKFVTINLENKGEKIDISSSSKIPLFKLAKNSIGYLSILPIRDFDFDFYSTEYNRDADSNLEGLWDWYQSGPTGINGLSPVFNYAGPTSIGSTGQITLNNTIGPSSNFVTNGGFQRLTGIVDEFLDTTEEVTNEYDRLRENDLPQLALSSRVVPFISKWVYDNESVDVRENPYRLNADQSFGYSSFSPVDSETSTNKKYFTHEWYYLQKYPPYMSFDEKVNSFSYFDEDINAPQIPLPGSSGATATITTLVGSTGNLLSLDEDYFLSYFTRETVGGTAIPRDFKYSIFSYGDDVKFSETLFRGNKVIIKRRAETSKINYNVESKRYIPTPLYNDYKFSAVLTYSDSATTIQFIKNEKWKTVTMLIKASLENALLSYNDGITDQRFIDRSHLYTVRDIFEVDPSGELQYKDVVLSGSLNGNGAFHWQDLGTGNGFIVYGSIDSNGSSPNFLGEITLNENGGYNDIEITNGTNTYTFTGIFDITSTSFKCLSITGPGMGTISSNGSNSLPVTGGFPTWLPFQYSAYYAPLAENPVYQGGGFNAFSLILDELSFANISFKVNSGDRDIRYITVKDDGSVIENDFFIELVKLDEVFKGSYLTTIPTQNRPQELTTYASDISTLGYEISANSTLTVNEILRSRGGFNPKFRNIMKFIDTQDIKDEGLDYQNIQILTETPDIQDDTIGIIDSLYFNKVNIENPNIILSPTEENRFIFPALGQIAIDYRDLFVFKSNWDPEYYRSYPAANISNPVIGTRGVIENKSFMGSKIISIKDVFTINTFGSSRDNGQDPLATENQARISRIPVFFKKDLVSGRGSVNNLETFDLRVRVFTTIELEDALIADGFGTEFTKYVNPLYSFGEPDLIDDIRQYIQFNITKRYSIREVVLWEKVYSRDPEVTIDQLVVGLTNEQKIEQGYQPIKRFNYTPLVAGSLNFDLIYRIPTDKRTSIAVEVILEKK